MTPCLEFRVEDYLWFLAAADANAAHQEYFRIISVGNSAHSFQLILHWEPR